MQRRRRAGDALAALGGLRRVARNLAALAVVVGAARGGAGRRRACRR